MTPPQDRSTGSNTPPSVSDRATLIDSIRTPLGYFALTLLIIETLLFVIVNKATGFDFTLLSISMVIIFFFIVIIVGYIVYNRPDALTNNNSGNDNQNTVNMDQFRKELLNDGIIRSLDYIARHNPDDYIRIACAHTVRSCRPDRAKSLLEDASEDQAVVVKTHAEKILVKFYQK